MNHAKPSARPVWYLLAIALVVSGLSVGGWGQAVAAVVEPEVVTRTTTTVDGSCGFRTKLTSTSTVTRTVKLGKGPTAGFPFVTEKIEYVDVYAHPVTGRTLFVVRGKFQFKITKAKPLGGSLYEVTAKESGLRMSVADSRGRPRGHDSGAVTYRFVADQDGNGIEFLGARVPGPEPRSKCSIVGSFMGTGSASRMTAHPIGTTTSPLGYYEYLPPGYRSGAPKPLLLFFHGFGGSGDGTAAQLPLVVNDAAIPLYINSNNWPADRPFVVLAPQHNAIDDPDRPYECQYPYDGTCVMQEQHDRGNPLPVGSPCTTPQEVTDFLEYAVTHYNVDPSRIYLTGLSCGAYGVWEAIPLLGDQIAAAVPIAGNGVPAVDSSTCDGWSAPLWAFHGDADDVVNSDGSTEAIEQLRDCPSAPGADDLRLTVYAGVDHNSWDRAYTGTGDEDIFKWMLESVAN